MKPIAGGQLMQFVAALPPALAPMPILDSGDVIEPPLPAVSAKPSTTGGIALPPAAPSAASRSLINSGFLFFIMLLLNLAC